MLRKYFVCTVAMMMVLGVGLTGCKKKKEEPASPTDIATQTDMTTTAETTTETTTAEAEIVVEETNEKGEKQTVVKPKSSSSSGDSGNSGKANNNSGDGQAAAPATKAPAPVTTAKPARTWSYQSGLSASIENAINSYRQSQGLPALAISGSCRSQSKTRAEYNAANDRTGHGGAQISYSGTKNSASAIVGAWKASSGHNANMLDDLAISIGAAAYKDSNGTYDVVVTFGY